MAKRGNALVTGWEYAQEYLAAHIGETEPREDSAKEHHNEAALAGVLQTPGEWEAAKEISGRVLRKSVALEALDVMKQSGNLPKPPMKSAMRR